MSKSTRNAGKPWSWADDCQLKRLRNEYLPPYPIRVVALKLGRTQDAVRSRERYLIVTGLFRQACRTRKSAGG